WCQKRNYCETNPAKLVDPIQEEPPDTNSLTLEHCLLILQELKGMDKAIWCTLFLSGVRIGELKGLRRGDLSTSNHQLVVERSVYKMGATAVKRYGKPFQQTKSGKDRKLTIPQLLCDILGEWRDQTRGDENPYDLMFTNPRTHGVINDDEFRKALKSAATIAATKVKGSEPLDLADAKCHKARSAFARIYLSLGGNIEDLRRELGHTRIETTMKYLRWAPGYKKSAFDLITGAELGIALGTRFSTSLNDQLRSL
ncbi:MAG: site-specific integrase, partial [Coriobacteriia bacterium]|nr:site-specific integrase [Coriobacteriia bacterium]